MSDARWRGVARRTVKSWDIQPLRVLILLSYIFCKNVYSRHFSFSRTLYCVKKKKFPLCFGPVYKYNSKYVSKVTACARQVVTEYECGMS